MTLQLIVIAGQDKGRSFELKDGNHSMGRGQDVPFQLGDPRVSRTHCVFEVDGDNVRVIDAGSSGGTSLNGMVVSSEQLKPGDEVALGESLLRFVVGDKPTITGGRPWNTLTAKAWPASSNASARPECWTGNTLTESQSTSPERWKLRSKTKSCIEKSNPKTF